MPQSSASISPGPDSLKVFDKELSGALNQALETAGHKQFSLLLAMLQQDFLARPRYASATVEDETPASLPASNYPKPGLATREQDWHNAQQITLLLQQQQPGNARLWQTMHPQPLSLKNDANAIPPELINNMSWDAQLRHSMARRQQPLDPQISTEPAAILDVLDKLHGKSTAAESTTASAGH